MADVIGSIALCSSLRSLICDEQGVGKYPLWKKYPQLQQIISGHISEQYRSFLAQPVGLKEADGEHIVWYAQCPHTAHPVRLTQLTGAEQEKYKHIKDITIEEYKKAIEQCKVAGDLSDAEHLEKAMKHVGSFDDYFYCFDDKVVVVVWGMRPRNIADAASCIIDKTLIPNQSYTVTFDLGEHGLSTSQLELHKRASDQPIGEHQIPKVDAKDGYKFIGWNQEPLNHKVTQDITFVAQYEELPKPPTVVPPILPPDPLQPNSYTIRFLDEAGNELSSCVVEEGNTIPKSAIPNVTGKEHYKFAGWGADLQSPVHEDRTYHLRYDKIPLSWWDRFKNWWIANNIWKWLLRLLLLLLLLLLLFLLRKCCNDWHCLDRDHHKESRYDGRNPFIPVDSLSNNPSDSQDTAGLADPSNPNLPPSDDFLYPPISEDDPGFEFLPEEPNKPVPIDDGDIVDDKDSIRQIVGNRLNVLLDDDALSINEFAADFKNAYPDDKYSIIYADPIIKRLQLQVPTQEREKIKSELIGKLPSKYTTDNVFIWDEALMVGSFTANDTRLGECWYHNSIKTFPAWDISMGGENIIVAVADDGFDLTHDEFKGKIVKPYNVFTKTANVSESKEKHGTHVAGLAVAAANNQTGIAGVAPNCKLMPVKVFDEQGRTSVMPVLDGVLYAVYNHADVVNLSLGLVLKEGIPESVQREMIRTYYKEEERVWKKVFAIANRNNTSIIIAAGNENLMAGIEPMHRSDDVIVVAAVGKDHSPLYNKTDFSNYGQYTDLSAPGFEILSTVGKNKYQIMSGTSMSAPIVSGAVALMKSVNPTLATAKIRKILQDTGLKVNGNIGNLIQLDKALAKAKGDNSNTTEDHPVPSTGDVQILLEWHNYNDLDLSCEDPNGDVVTYERKVIPSGGQLEIDMNAGDDAFSSNPIENIFWPVGKAPLGHYAVYTTFYKEHDSNASTDYKVIVRYNSKEDVYTGTLNYQGERHKICDFTLQ